MIPSTAKVAIPAARPDRRISASPTASAKAAPTPGRERERRDVADVVREEEVREARHRDLLLALRDREHPGRPGADRDEADRPEGEDTRVADEDVERDHDRDLDRACRGSTPGDSSRPRGRAARSRARARPVRAAPGAGGPGSYALHRGASAGEQPVRPDEQHDDHRGEDEARQVLALVRREDPAQQPEGEADREAAERGRESAG